MMDGLALGETTPGPLIMVVAFVAFIGGYVKAPLGPESLFAAGAFDARSALIAVGAAVALFKYKRSVMEVICLCALVGLTVKLLPL
jgi:hypothetical protein